MLTETQMFGDTPLTTTTFQFFNGRGSHLKSDYLDRFKIGRHEVSTLHLTTMNHCVSILSGVLKENREY